MSAGLIRLYNLDGCGSCTMVREALTRLGLKYETIDVPWAHHQRTEVMEISGQPTVPVLVDGEVVLSDERDIIHYLKTKYAKT